MVRSLRLFKAVRIIVTELATQLTLWAGPACQLAAQADDIVDNATH